MSITSNIYLERKCEKFHIPVEIMDINDLSILQPNMCYIINLGNNSHWTALYIHDKAIIYHDSFGVVPPLKIIKLIQEYANEHGKINYHYNTKTIQNLESGYCGLYCFLFLYFMNKGNESYDEKLKNYQNQFSTNHEMNKRRLIKELHVIDFYNDND